MGKSFGNVFDTQKKFFSGHFFTFFEKKFKKNLENFLRVKSFSKFFLNFFFKKSVLKKNFFECQKNFQNFFRITFYIFLKIFGKKKSVR